MSLEIIPQSSRVPCCRWSRIVLGSVLFLGAVGAVSCFSHLLPFQSAQAAPNGTAAPQEPREEEEKANPAPELEGGTAWLNTAGPLKLKDLRGKIVLLDFWTFCCINCIHTLPDLARLEKKYEKQLVVIGVHSAKFESEKKTENIRKAILRYEIAHPVVNDAQMKIWDRYGARSWPTLVLIDPEGNYVGYTSGEGNYDLLDRVIGQLIEKHRKKKTLNEKPIKFQLARADEDGSSPLFFPGKILADAKGKRLFIADSTHHRILITDLEGKKIAIAGNGTTGTKDGAFDQAQFNDPQGMALHGSTLYVADRKNHLLRALDLDKKTVTTIAGNGEQGSFLDRQRATPVAARKIGLNSPWALYLNGNDLFIAMAGHHQIWKMDLKKNEVVPYAGAGPENILDGTLQRSLFAQPSGLTSDGTTLYVADSEVSAIRAVPLNGKGEVKTLVGEGLFEFGDKDGMGDQVRLQHALGVQFHNGKIFIADTYNNKIKTLDPKTRKCETFLGGDADGWLAGSLFNEPAGLSFANGKLYVSDTNAHRIRVVDLKTKAVRTLRLQGVTAPKNP